MTVTTLNHFTNQLVPAADITKAQFPAPGGDFFFPNSTGWVVGSTQQSWRLTVDKTGVPDGVKYLTLAVEYQYFGGWQLDYSNAPAGWVGGIEFADDGSQSRIDHAASTIGFYGPDGNLLGARPTHARLHILFSNGSTLPSILIQVADDKSLA